MPVENRFAAGASSDPGFTGGADGARTHGEQDADETANDRGPAAFDRLVDQIRELREQFVLLVAAKIDSIRLTARRLVIACVLGLLGLVILATYLVTSTVLVIVGIGEGLGSLFGDRLWLGHLTTGLGLLGILGIGGYLALRRATRASRERTVDRYARRREQTGTGRTADE